VSTTSPTLDQLGPVSPELALVDPELRRRLLAIGQETTARLPNWAPGPREHLHPEAEEEPVASGDRGERAALLPPRRRATYLTLVVAASMIAFVLGAKLAAPSSLGWPAAPAFGSQAQMTPPSNRLASIEAGASELAWARSAGASGYEVAIDRGGRTVFDARTTAPEIFLTPSEQAAIPRGSLTWFVWPLQTSGQAGPPVVQSKLVLDP
jgi:hypothetical protein